MFLNTPIGFAPQRAADRWLLPVYVVVIWATILLGFVPEILRHAASGAPGYPLVIHIHAAAFVGWLALFSVQVALIRARQYAVHKRIGAFGAVLALAMVVLGPWAGIVSEQVHFGTPQSDPPFLSIEFVEMIAFALLVGAAIGLRRDAAAHKRLMLLATLLLTTAGFGRWLSEPLHAVFGDGFGRFLVEFYGATTLLILLLGAYDIVTRRRLHPAYTAGAALGIASQVVAAWLYFSPWWKLVPLHLIGR